MSLEIPKNWPAERMRNFFGMQKVVMKFLRSRAIEVILNFQSFDQERAFENFMVIDRNGKAHLVLIYYSFANNECFWQWYLMQTDVRILEETVDFVATKKEEGA